MPNPNTPVVNKGLLYVNGLTVANVGALLADNVSTANLIVSSGQGRDSTDINDIVLPNTITQATAIATGNPNNVPIDANAPNYTLNFANGARANGLDTGALAAATLYAVYAIASSNSAVQPATLLSLSFSQPLLPFGFDMYRRIGSVFSNAAGTGFTYFHQRGNGSGRFTYYMTNFPTAVVAGASATWAPVTLTTWVPSTASHVVIKSVLTSDAGATRTVIYDADAAVTVANGAAGAQIMSSPASTVTSSSLFVPVTTAAAVQTIQYAVSNTAAAVAVTIEGFLDLL